MIFLVIIPSFLLGFLVCMLIWQAEDLKKSNFSVSLMEEQSEERSQLLESFSKIIDTIAHSTEKTTKHIYEGDDGRYKLFGKKIK